MYANSVEKRDELEPNAGQARRLYRFGSSAYTLRSLTCALIDCSALALIPLRVKLAMDTPGPLSDLSCVSCRFTVS